MNASPARKQLVKSLSAVLAYVGEGGLADTTLPTAPAAEAVRLLRNGMSVALFASVEMFVRDRIGELLSELASDENRPDFKNLPNALQLAATIGVVDAIRFRFGQRQDEFETSEVIRAAQAHAANIASTSGRQYVFSALTFGQGSSNINEGVLRGFFQAVQSNQLYDAMGPVLTEMHFNFRAVDLANENGSFSFKKFARWRHTAAHDALATVDSSILLSRIRACMMVAFAFDCLASTAVDRFMSHFPSLPSVDDRPSRPEVTTMKPKLDSTSFLLEWQGQTREYYSVEHGRSDLPEKSRPGTVIGVLDADGSVVDWFYA